jgi:uncharacterized delta-60 repeat protein
MFLFFYEVAIMKRFFLLLLCLDLGDARAQGSIIISPRTSSVFLKSLTDTSVNQAGLPDKKFARGGLLKQPFLTENVFNLATGLALVPDKKLVLAGYVGDPMAGQWKIALVRYYPTGQLDYSFGFQGTVIHQFSDLLYDQINTVVAQPDGTLLIGGETRSGGMGQYKFLVARYTDRGVLDSAYGQGGKVNQPFLGTGLYDEINALCVHPNKYASAIGYSKDAGGQKIALARYDSSGTLDVTFGSAGTVLQSFLGDQHLDCGVAGLVCSDGTLLVGGTSSDEGIGQIKCVVARYATTGRLVSIFGKAGVILQPFVGTGNHDEITCMALQAEGEIVVGGFSCDEGGQKALLMRYTSTGNLDATFGIGGIMKQPFLGAGATTDLINALVVQPDGKILVVGATNDGAGSNYFLARYHVNGVLDTSFGVAGIVKSSFIGDGAGDELHDVVLSSDGAVVASGYTQDGGGSKMFLIRAINAVDFSYYGGQMGGFHG